MSPPNKDVRVGELRPSQLITTFGVGSMVDLPNLSAIIMRLEEWPQTGKILAEPRLLAAVQQRVRTPHIEHLRQPPVEYDEGGDFAPGKTGVTVALFPQWLRCPACDALAPMRSEIFKVVAFDRYPDRTRVVHASCEKARSPTVVPARFLVACSNGHLDDFPWIAFVHRDRMDCPRPQLRLRKIGPSDEAADLMVECTECRSRRTLAEAFQDRDGAAPPAIGPCRARHPHLRTTDARCDERARPILLGASNSWFPIQLSALALPPTQADELAALVEEYWSLLANVDSPVILSYLIKQGQLPRSFEGLPADAVMAAIDAHRRPTVAPQDEPEDLKTPEWVVLTQHATERESADFKARLVDPPRGFEAFFQPTLMLDKLREVRALVGFTRIEAPGEFGEEPVIADDQIVPLSSGTANWVPAAEVRGEGIFLRFREDRIATWCARDDVRSREQALLDGYRRWRRERGLPADDDAFPGIRAVFIHSFSHALMRQIALSGGYAAASVRERIYARRSRHGLPMAGLLLYTAASDSEGTLGGLVALGNPAKLGDMIQETLEQMRLCASDPLCSEHDPQVDDFGQLQGAACHACLYSPETSCEYANRYLDRLLLTEGLGHPWASFFAS